VDRISVKELHFITPILNLQSVRLHGILSHELASRVPHLSVASAEVQSIRTGKRVPGGRLLHAYANLYFDARNPMMYKIKGSNTDLAVVCVSPVVLDLPEVVIADGNAASSATRFAASPGGLAILASERVYATSWTSADWWEYCERKRTRCAEVLVPDRVEPQYLVKARVVDASHVVLCESAGLRGEVSKSVFFQ
jgi:hypothetical protein